MELNREQAIDILKRFDFFQGQRAGRMLWQSKPFEVQEADIAKFSQDVAWLKNYINELTEEIERLRAEVSVKRKLLDKAEVRIECVEEENNQLKADICNATMNLEHITKENERLENRITATVILTGKDAEKIKNECLERIELDIRAIEASTVRKMQEALEHRIHSKLSYHGWYLKETVIAATAKEMLEGESHE